MAGSLFDQLKNVGLIDEQKARKAKKDKHQQAKQNKSQKGGKHVDPELSDTARQAAEIARQKADRDRQLNLERQQQQAKKAAQAEIRQIIAANGLQDVTGNRLFWFADGHWLKSLSVRPEIQQRLAIGSLRIAPFERGYVVIPQVAAEKVLQRDPSALIPPGCDDASRIPEGDRDYYAGFPVPDDLGW